MPEFDGTATRRTCVNVSDVLINVVRVGVITNAAEVAWLGLVALALPPWLPEVESLSMRL